MVLAVKGEFQSTPSARRATLHPALEACFIAISIHALRGESDLLWNHFQNLMGQFQSTPSAGRATSSSAPAPCPDGNFNPRPPRGERQNQCCGLPGLQLFQSTPSARRATGAILLLFQYNTISIHALREEGDCGSDSRSTVDAYFNPRPPRGGRLCPVISQTPCAYFNPRPPRGGRPAYTVAAFPAIFISIHALREEGDRQLTVAATVLGQFQSTPSARRATAWWRRW